MHLGWELFWFMVILKIPVVYLACVVWWALRAPRPLEPAVAVRLGEPEPSHDPLAGRRLPARSLRPLRGGPHGSPRRVHARAAARATATAERR